MRRGINRRYRSDSKLWTGVKSAVFITDVDMEDDEGQENDLAIQWDGSVLQFYTKQEGTWGVGIGISLTGFSTPTNKGRTMKLKEPHKGYQLSGTAITMTTP